MSQRFNPRYIFRHHANESSVLAMTGVRHDDFLRILDLCEQSLGVVMPDEVTHQEQYRREQAETIAALRNGGFTVSKTGMITVAFDQYDRRRQSQPLSLQRVENIMTTAFLRWSDQIDPNHTILIRLKSMLSPTTYSYLTEEGEAALSPEDQRYFHLQQTLKDRLDAPRMARYGTKWKGAKNGSFGRVVDMTPAQKADRIKEMKDRKGFDDRMNQMFADMHAKKMSPVQVLIAALDDA